MLSFSPALGALKGSQGISNAFGDSWEIDFQRGRRPSTPKPTTRRMDFTKDPRRLYYEVYLLAFAIKLFRDAK